MQSTCGGRVTTINHNYCRDGARCLVIYGAMTVALSAHGDDRFTVDWYLNHPAQRFIKLASCQHNNADSFGASCRNARKALTQVDEQPASWQSAASPLDGDSAKENSVK